MKKLVFTALAVVAFSRVLEAKTVKVKKRNIKKELRSSCCALYKLAYDLAIKEGASQFQAGTYANQVENNCEGIK